MWCERTVSSVRSWMKFVSSYELLCQDSCSWCKVYTSLREKWRCEKYEIKSGQLSLQRCSGNRDVRYIRKAEHKEQFWRKVWRVNVKAELKFVMLPTNSIRREDKGTVIRIKDENDVYWYVTTQRLDKMEKVVKIVNTNTYANKLLREKTCTCVNRKNRNREGKSKSWTITLL